MEPLWRSEAEELFFPSPMSGSWGTNSDGQAWCQVLLSIKIPLQPFPSSFSLGHAAVYIMRSVFSKFTSSDYPVWQLCLYISIFLGRFILMGLFIVVSVCLQIFPQWHLLSETYNAHIDTRICMKLACFQCWAPGTGPHTLQASQSTTKPQLSLAREL